MRVIFIPDVVEYYGATEALLQMIILLADNYGVEPVILTSGTGRIAQFACEHGFESYAIGHLAFLNGVGSTTVKRVLKEKLKPFLIWRYQIRNWQAIKKAETYVDFSNVDLIHTNVNRNDIGALLAKKYNLPHVWHIREFGDLDYDCVSMRKDYISFMNDHTSVFPVISDAVKEHWAKKGIGKEQMRLVYDGVNETRFNPGKKEETQNGLLRIVFCGSLNETKGQWQLIEAIARLEPPERQQLCVDIYGSGTKEYVAFLQQKIREYGLENTVHMRGYCDCMEAKLPDYDIGMMCSRSEGFGLVTVEYMMSGLCVIASNTGANPELVSDGECGLLYRYGDIDHLTEKLRFALSHRGMLQEMGKKARVHACENFTAARNAAQIYAIYQELTAGKNGSTKNDL